MGLADFILSVRGTGQGMTHEQVLARAARDREPEAFAFGPEDDDDRMAELLTRGYVPGAMQNLSLELARAQELLEAEQAKLRRSARQAELLRREHDLGKIGAFDLMRMSDDEGDPGRVMMLESRIASLRGQLAEMTGRAAIPPDPAKAAMRSAQLAEAERLLARSREVGSDPFMREQVAAFDARRSGAPDCAECAEAGASAEESALIHRVPGVAG